MYIKHDPVWRSRQPDFSGCSSLKIVIYNIFDWSLNFSQDYHVVCKYLLACFCACNIRLMLFWELTLALNFLFFKIIVCACSSRNPGQQSIQSTVWCLGLRDHHVYIVSHIHSCGTCLHSDGKMCAHNQCSHACLYLQI